MFENSSVTRPPGSVYHEAPSLAARVEAGDLPPVEERLPVNPVVIRPVFDAEGAVAARVTVDGVEDRICVLADKDARPPEGFGHQRHRIQLTNGAFEKSLLFDLEEPGHDVPGFDGPTPAPGP